MAKKKIRMISFADFCAKFNEDKEVAKETLASVGLYADTFENRRKCYNIIAAHFKERGYLCSCPHHQPTIIQ